MSLLKHPPNSVLMLAQRHRRWDNIKKTLGGYNVLVRNTRHSPNSALMLAQRRRRWVNIKTALGGWLVFAGTDRGRGGGG